MSWASRAKTSVQLSSSCCNCRPVFDTSVSCVPLVNHWPVSLMAIWRKAEITIKGVNVVPRSNNSSFLRIVMSVSIPA